MSSVFDRHFNACTIQENIREIEGRIISYRVLSRAFAPYLHAFAGYTPPEYEPVFVFVSEDVPEEYRPWVILHEFICNKERADVEGRCIQATSEELMSVPSGIFQEYRRFRLSYFARLVDHCESRQLATREVEEYRETRDFLFALVTGSRQ